jgi:hypothetical protein
MWSVETGISAATGTGPPAGVCNAGATYVDTQAGTPWFCESGAWQKPLTTDNTGPFVLTGQTGAAPVSTPTGTGSLYFSYPARLAQSIDDTGATATMVRPVDCSGAGQVVQKVNPDGTVTCAAPAATHAIGFTFDGGGSVLASGLTKYLTVPFACTIRAWNIALDTGRATIQTWKAPAGAGVPDATRSISVSGVSISSGTALHSAALTDFTTTAVNANDVLGFNLFEVAGATQVNFILECAQ